MCLSTNFQTNACGFFVCLFFFPDEIAFSSILRMRTIFFGRHSILHEKKSQLIIIIIIIIIINPLGVTRAKELENLLGDVRIAGQTARTSIYFKVNFGIFE